jgi:hypothetical protein
MKRWALAAVAIAAAGMTIMMGVQPVSAAGSGDIIPWALQAEDYTGFKANTVHLTTAQATTDAQNFNVIIAHPIAYSCPAGAPGGCTSDVAAMKAANPKLIILMYMNATFGQAALYQAGVSVGPQTDYGQCPGEPNAFPTSYYETGADGKVIYNNSKNSQTTTPNCLMVPNNASWIANRTAMCETEAAAAGYSGCYLDDLGIGPLLPGYLTEAPDLPGTKTPWTQANWLTATAGIAKGVHTGAKSKNLKAYGNGLTNGPDYYSKSGPTSIIMTTGQLDGGIAEGWLRQSTQSATLYPTAAQWLQNVQMIGAVEKLGKPLLTLTKMWSSTSVTVQTAWLQYSLSSFLLGTGGKSEFFYSPFQTEPRTTSFPLYMTALGTPSGAMVKGATGYYTRKFATGLVAVNPGTATVTVTSAANLFASAGCPGFAVKTKVPAGGLSMPKDTGCILTTS